MKAAQWRGKHIGRPRKMKRYQILLAKNKLDRGTASLGEIASLYDVHPRTLSRKLQEV